MLSITGPRQSGKTTLVQQVFPDYEYADLENPLTREYARENPFRFLRQAPQGIILDEAQRLPELFSYVQVHVDETRQNGRVILTGSQNFLLLEKITQSLAGRVALFHLLPFSVQELKGTAYELPDPFQYIYRGLFPRLYDQSASPEVFYPSYIQTYVERDVRQVQSIGDLMAFERFLHLCAGRIGQKFNQSAVATEVGVSAPTIARWMSVLQASFVAYLLPPYFQNFNKRIVRTPKLYFYDTGLACALLRIRSAAELDTHFARGALFENFIVNEIHKNLLNAGIRPDLYFWADSAGHEVDLLLKQGQRLYAFEIKAADTLHADYFRNLALFQQLSGASPEDCYLIYAGAENQERSVARVRAWNALPEV
ncbi:MAG: ATP-binding protein [Saprospiraceae bacterium]|nr:ATP-binding protein [Saprospiraceae bacterium]MDW8230883.1 ATP-binding protein [Saprospiraceae bacterium]